MRHFSLPLRVYLEDTDAGGIVYHASYLRFMERARSDWLRALGVDLPDWQRSERRLFVVRSMALEFERPAALGERLDATLAVEKLGRASLMLAQRVEREGLSLVHAAVRLACIDADTLSAVAIPPAIREAMSVER